MAGAGVRGADLILVRKGMGGDLRRLPGLAPKPSKLIFLQPRAETPSSTEVTKPNAYVSLSLIHI